MITDHQILKLDGKNGKNLVFEVNFDDKDETKECAVVKVSIGEEVSYIDKKDLHAFMFLIGSPKEQVSLVPQRVFKKRRFEGLVRIKAMKDIHKGEEIIATCYHDLPGEIDEVIQESDKTKKSPIIVPTKV